LLGGHLLGEDLVQEVGVGNTVLGRLLERFGRKPAEPFLEVLQDLDDRALPPAVFLDDLADDSTSVVGEGVCPGGTRLLAFPLHFACAL